MKKNKKAQAIDQLATMVVSLIAVAIVLGVGMVILVQVLDQTNDIVPDGCCANKTQFFNGTLFRCCEYDCNGTHCDSGSALVDKNVSEANCSDTNMDFVASCNSTIDVIDAADDVPGWLGVIVIVIIGAILIALVSVFRRQ